MRTGLSARGNYQPIQIPAAAESVFKPPIPLGPFTAWQRCMGQQFAPRGVIDLNTGIFVRSGVNRTQVQWYVIDIRISGTATAVGGLQLYALPEAPQQ